MKKAEIILGLVCLVAIVLDILLLPKSNDILVIFLSSLALLYVSLGQVLFNGLSLKQLFFKSSKDDIGKLRYFLCQGIGMSFGIALVGVLFTLQIWPFRDDLLQFGSGALVLALIVTGLLYLKTKSSYYIDFLKRIGIYGGLVLIFMILPKHTWLELKYGDYPDFIEAVKAAHEDSTNQELIDKVAEERNKIIESQ